MTSVWILDPENVVEGGLHRRHGRMYEMQGFSDTALHCFKAHVAYQASRYGVIRFRILMVRVSNLEIESFADCWPQVLG